MGHPKFPKGDFTFTPISREGAHYPKHQDKECRGYNLQTIPLDTLRSTARLNLSYLIHAYQDFPDKSTFFINTNFFDKLAGGKSLKEQVIAGKTEEEIRQTWQEGLSEFKEIRKKYLLYDDFK